MSITSVKVPHNGFDYRVAFSPGGRALVVARQFKGPKVRCEQVVKIDGPVGRAVLVKAATFWPLPPYDPATMGNPDIKVTRDISPDWDVTWRQSLACAYVLVSGPIAWRRVGDTSHLALIGEDRQVATLTRFPGTDLTWFLRIEGLEFASLHNPPTWTDRRTFSFATDARRFLDMVVRLTERDLIGYARERAIADGTLGAARPRRSTSTRAD